jgi:hypothetical protein
MPRGDSCVCCTHPHAQNALCLSTECCVQIALQQHVDFVVICKIASIEDDCLERDVHSMSSGMDATDHHKVLH